MLKTQNESKNNKDESKRVLARWVKLTVFCLQMCIVSSLGTVQIGFAEESAIDSNQTKIVGGETAVKGAWPWMAALLYSDINDFFSAQFCGGALITKKWVLTAAHCVYNGSSLRAAGEIDVAMGVHDLTTNSGDRISVKRIVPYPGYNSRTNDGDLALLELARESSEETLALFTDSSNSLSGETGTLIGWGNQASYDIDYAEKLQQVEVPIVSNSVCNASYSNQITSNMVCAGYSYGGKDSCQGDSGGPLMVYYNNKWRHAGIVSWGYGCALAGYYGVNTRTSQYISFIESYVGEVEKTPSGLIMAPIYLLLQQAD
ncbi:S1 family peptidase [Desulfogranum japonicum]|uniref:S1 family peptidase n=1 Tax=Desulfogranum japonicum TaxID=231447 RepID=UPI0004198754|nr:serine protease [Desulfogranum japonicum]